MQLPFTTNLYPKSFKAVLYYKLIPEKVLACTALPTAIYFRSNKELRQLYKIPNLVAEDEDEDEDE
jgi:hypothetical protein